MSVDRAALLARIRAALRSRSGDLGDDSDISDLPDTAFSEIPQSAFDALAARWDALAGNGQPIDDLFDSVPQDAANQAALVMLNGLSQGPLAIAQNLAQVLQMSESRAETIARNELVSSYRDAQMANYRANSDVVGSWMWSAAIASACIMCVEMDGTIHSMDEDLLDHVCGRCEPLPITKSWDDIMAPYGLSADGIPETSITESYGTGHDWFMSQDAATQRDILGPAKFEAWSRGDISLNDLVGVRDDGAWGNALYERSLKELGLDAHDYLPHAPRTGLGPRGAEAVAGGRAAIPEPELVRVDLGNGMFTYVDPYENPFAAAPNMAGRDTGWQSVDDVLAGLRGETVEPAQAVEEAASHEAVSADDIYQQMRSEGERVSKLLNDVAPDNLSYAERQAAQVERLTKLADRVKDDPGFQKLVDKLGYERSEMYGLGPLDHSLTPEMAAINEIQATWNGAIGMNAEAQVVAMRMAVRDAFGLKDKVTAADATVMREARSLYRSAGDGLQALARAVHDQTQEFFEEHGITELTVYRGRSWSELSAAKAKAFDGSVGMVDVPLRAISSYSTDPDVAYNFALNGDYSMLVADRVPVSSVWSSAFAGFGTPGEAEVLLIGDARTMAAYRWQSDVAYAATQTEGEAAAQKELAGILHQFAGQFAKGGAATATVDMGEATGAAIEASGAIDAATAAETAATEAATTEAAAETTVSFATDAVQTRLMDRLDNPSEAEFARLMGAQPGDRVEVNRYGEAVVHGDGYDAVRYVLSPDADGGGQGMWLQGYQTPGPDGVQLPIDERFAAMLRTQVEAAQETGSPLTYLGMKARSGTADYEDLLKVGFDAPIDVHVLGEARGPDLVPPLLPGEFAAKFPGVHTLGELVSTPEGAAWWHEMGLNPDLRFDLTPGSDNIAQLNDYLRAHDMAPVAEVTAARG